MITIRTESEKQKTVVRSRSRLEPPLLGWSLAGADFLVSEPFFLLAGAERRSRFFKAAPAQAASFCQAEKESLVVVTKQDLRAIYNGKCDPKKTCIDNSLFSF